MAFPGDYTKYQEVTIDNTKVSADLTDFPVYVDLSDMVLAGADIFDTCRSDGGDIRVTKSDGTTELAREVVAIDTTAKTGELHIKYTGTLSSSSDTTIRIWYNGTDTEPAESATYGKNNVWTGYHAVWHMGALDNAQSSSFDLVENGTISATAGKLNSAANGAYDYTDDTDFHDNSSALTISTDSTITMWANPDVVNKTMLMTDYYAGAGARAFAMYITNSGVLNFVRYGSGTTIISSSASAVAAGSWQHFAFRAPASNVYSYVNASQVATDTHSDTFNTTAGTPVTIGNRQDNTALGFDGGIDEVRISSGDLSTSWLSTEYNNQNSPSTFYSVGAEQTSGGGGATPTNPSRHLWW